MDGFLGNIHDMSTMARGTDGSILVLIRIIVWIQEFVKDFFYQYILKKYCTCWALVEVCTL